MNYRISVNNITFKNGYSLDFEFPIKETLFIDDTIIIVVEPPFDNSYHQNVFAFSSLGNFLWRISKTELFYSGGNTCFFVGVIINDDGELVLFNWCDTAVVVNSLTGEIIRKYHTK